MTAHATLVYKRKNEKKIYVTSNKVWMYENPQLLDETTANESLFVDVDSNTNYEHFQNKFIEFGYKVEKDKDFKYKYKDKEENEKEGEYKLFKFEKKDEYGNTKVHYGIKAMNIPDDVEQSNMLLSFSKHLQERHLNKKNGENKYKDVVFNCDNGISRSVTLAVNAAICDNGTTDKNKRLKIIKEVIQKRHEKLEDVKSIQDGKLEMGGILFDKKTSIITAFNYYHNNKTQEEINKEWNQATELLKKNAKGYFDVLYRGIVSMIKKREEFNNKIDDIANTATQTLDNKDKTDFLSKEDIPFEERKDILNEIIKGNPNINTTKDTWFEGFEKSSQGFSQKQLTTTSGALSSGKISKMLSPLKDAGEEEQLKRLKERKSNLKDQRRGH
jgi:hypothetical protein